ncbi:MAG: DUF4349 domain-containing protein [Spirochaetia bacterium]|nr:DUF4349 domain-containing protein [Spirochaetia bacterium]
MNKNISKGLLIGLVVFVLMFIFRLIYSYVATDKINENSIRKFELLDESGSMYQKKNIASKKIKYKENESSSKSIDQKYEKVANIDTQSKDIETDEKKVRDIINTSGSVIQYENSSGLKNRHNRVIKIAAGVPPEKFDEQIDEFKKIGTTLLLTINKNDKTNEYKDLQAKKESLLKIRNSLTNLKNKGGKIDEFINLENRILEIEKEIQTLGINLGEYDSENEFCTILLTMYENKSSSNVHFIHHIKVALEWTIKYFFLMSLSFIFLYLLLYFGFPLLEKYMNLLVVQKVKKK